jgi:putative hemolysin
MSLSEQFEKILFEKFKTDNDKFNDIIKITLIKLLKNISGVDLYEKICTDVADNLSVANQQHLDIIFENLNIKPVIYSNEIENKNKQYLIVSNHPTGPLDGIFVQKILGALDLHGKIVGDDIMAGLEQLKDAYIGLSIRDDGKSKIAQLRRIKREILNGCSIVLFPAGSVSHFSIKEKRITDYEWQTGFIHIAKSNNLDIIPVYIDSNLSILHYIFKEIYSDLSSLRLFRESISFIKKNSGKSIEFYIGQPIKSSDLQPTLEDAQKVKEICENLMFQSYKNIKM